MARYTEEQHDFIVANAKGNKYREIADRFNAKYGTNKSTQAIATYCRKYNIDNGITSSVTQYSKGHTNNVWQEKPLGSEKYNQHGDVLIKVSMVGNRWERWKKKKEVIWEQAYGQKPDRYIIMHLNGDKDDNRLENLIACRVVEYVNLSRYGYISSDPQLTLSGLYYIRLVHLIRKRERELKGKR